MNLNDVIDRLLPSIGDARAETELRIQFSEFDSRLSNGDEHGASIALAKVKKSLDALSERTTANGYESADVSVIRLEVNQAESALSDLADLQKKS